MANPFENLNINEDIEIFNIMKFNPDMTFVKGYKNVFCEKNKNDKDVINSPFLYLMLNNKAQFNYDNVIPNNQDKFFQLNQIAPQNLMPNMVIGGYEPNNPNNNYNPNNNFSMYDINNNKISDNEPPDQFKSFVNEPNNNNVNNNINNNVNNNVNNNNLNDIKTINEVPNINNDVYKNFPEPNQDNDNNNNNSNNTNIKNPIFQAMAENNNNNNNSNINGSIKLSLNQDDLNAIEKCVDSAIDLDMPNSFIKADEVFKIYFIYRDSQEPIEYITNPDKKFSEVLTSFLAEKDVKFKELPKAIHNCNLVNQENTLKENYIKNGDEILLYNLTKNKSQTKLDYDDLEIMKKFAEEFKANKLFEYRCLVENMVKEKKKNIPKFDLNSKYDDFIAFLFYKTDNATSGIKILEHEHDLVCVLTNFGWKCNLCKKDYSCQEEKFYCSICDFYMCHKCRKQKDYERRKAIKRDITPENDIYREKYLNSKLHEHKLIYCITSRNCCGESVWNCDKCEKESNTWNFYCTYCDYDLCAECALNNK